MKHLYLLIFVGFSSFLQAQSQFDLSYYLPKNVTYNQDIPTPQDLHPKRNRSTPVFRQTQQ